MQKMKSILIVLMFCSATQMLYGQYIEMVYDGMIREYAVYEPTLDPNPEGYPLLIGLHGAGSEG